MTKRVLLGLLAVLLFVLIVLSIPIGVMVGDREREHLLALVVADAQEIAASVDGWLLGVGTVDGTEIVERYEVERDGRVVVVDAEGVAVADSGDGRAGEEDFRNRPEIDEALAGDVSTGIRTSVTAGGDLAFAAVPVLFDGKVIGAVRITYPAATINDRVRDVWLRLGGLGAVVLAAGAVVAWFIARSVTEPVRDLAAAAGRIGAGHTGVRVGTADGPPELRELAASFDDMAAKLDALGERQRSFVADASHQLRTPLTALRLRLDALAEAGCDPDAVQAATAEAARLSDLADALLGVARLDAADPQLRDVPLFAAVSDRVAMWEPLATENGVAFVVDLDIGDDAGVWAPDDGVNQILDNLFSNALDVVDRDGTITVGARRAGDRIELSVADDGPGMPPDQRARAFERFWRAPGAGPGGTGLGLAVVAGIAATSGGRAVIEANEPTGVRVVVSFRSATVDPSGSPSRRRVQ